MRRASKIDRNQGEIVSALKAVGCDVKSLAAVGDGCPDLLVLCRGVLYLMEIKDGTLPPSRRKLTPDQVKFHDSWRGPIGVIKSVEEALQYVGMIESP